jgi:hypothetical protein
VGGFDDAHADLAGSDGKLVHFLGSHSISPSIVGSVFVRHSPPILNLEPTTWLYYHYSRFFAIPFRIFGAVSGVKKAAAKCGSFGQF